MSDTTLTKNTLSFELGGEAASVEHELFRAEMMELGTVLSVQFNRAHVIVTFVDAEDAAMAHKALLSQPLRSIETRHEGAARTHVDSFLSKRGRCRSRSRSRDRRKVLSTLRRSVSLSPERLSAKDHVLTPMIRERSRSEATFF